MSHSFLENERRPGRLFVSLRVQKTSGAEALHADCAPSLAEMHGQVKKPGSRSDHDPASMAAGANRL
jgi:hypothetical protein